MAFPVELRPTPNEVAALVRTRTVSVDGTESPTFTDTTTPTSGEANALIEQAYNSVLAQLPVAVDPKFNGQIRHLIALYTAILIEGSYHRDALADSAVNLWMTLFTDGMKALDQALNIADGIGPQFGSISITRPPCPPPVCPDPFGWPAVEWPDVPGCP